MQCEENDEGSTALRAEVATLSSRCESLQASNQELRQVVKEYRSGRFHDMMCYAYDEFDHRCPPCIKADALLENKPESAPKPDTEESDGE